MCKITQIFNILHIFYVYQLMYIKIVKDTHSKLVKRRYWYT